MSLICPACSNELTEITVSGIQVDVCKGGCGGVWFDNFELEKFDEQHEHAGEELLKIDINPDVVVNYEEKRSCPKCDDIKMMRHFFTVGRKVEIDECGGCGGVWLDVGELRGIRETFETEQARDQAFEEYFEDVFGETLRDQQNRTVEELEKTRKAVRPFRFICPSHYIRGKQSWGAF